MNAFVTPYALQPVNVVQVLFFALCLYGVLLLLHTPRFKALCLLLALEMLLMAFNFSEETRFFEQVFLVTPIFTLCTGPAFYLFVKHLVYADARWRRFDLFHFLPALLALPFTNFTQSVIAAGSLSLLAYGVISYRLLGKYLRASWQMSSAALDMRLNWLRTIMWFFVVLGVTDTIRLNLQTELDYEIINTWYLAHQFSILLLNACLIGLALRQPLLFDGLASFDDSGSNQKEHDLSIILFQQINQQILDAELFKQARLSLNDVASHLNIGIKDVSNAVNVGSGLNFCEYVNSLRVAEVKRKIDQDTDDVLTLLEIAFESGFNSKSSFNTSFKNATHLTPTQYQRQKRHQLT
ncbi:MAG: AraC-like DNA-binding protein [Arenicella sp.]|jgi:AraC-like DNA-binding protein